MSLSKTTRAENLQVRVLRVLRGGTIQARLQCGKLAAEIQEGREKEAVVLAGHLGGRGFRLPARLSNVVAHRVVAGELGGVTQPI